MACRGLIDLFALRPRGPWRVTCGWPSTRGTAATARVLGECWSHRASSDGTIEIIVSIALDDPLHVLGTLCHELLHAALPEGVGHRPPFGARAKALGLEGKPTATVVGPRFQAAVAELLAALGPFPGAALDVTSRKKQSTRLLKAQCPACGYLVRVTRVWLAVAIPRCPVDQVEMVAEGFAGTPATDAADDDEDLAAAGRLDSEPEGG